MQCWLSQSDIIVTGKMVAASRSQTSVAGWPVSGHLSCIGGKAEMKDLLKSRNNYRKATVALTLRGEGEGRDCRTAGLTLNFAKVPLCCCSAP